MVVKEMAEGRDLTRTDLHFVTIRQTSKGRPTGRA